MNARLLRDGKLRVNVLRSSLYTTKSSLPGWYSHRSLRLVLTTSVDELYWTRALANIIAAVQRAPGAYHIVPANIASTLNAVGLFALALCAAQRGLR